MRAACCAKFEEMAGSVSSVSPTAMIYAAAGVSNKAQFEKQEDGLWAINGCCGGGCYVVTEMKYCPFCGANVCDDKD